MRQLLYTSFLLIITLRFVSLVVKGKLAQPSKSLKILWTWLKIDLLKFAIHNPRVLFNWWMWTQDNARVTLGVIYYDSKRVLLKNYQYYQKICLQGFPLFWSINAILFGWVGAKMAYLSVFFKYLQNYLLNWLEIFRVWYLTVWKLLKKNCWR